MKTSHSILAIACSCLGLSALLGLRGGCYPELICPDLYIACPDLECPDGFKVDKNGCAICECIGDPAPVACMSDRDCGPGEVCDTVNFCDPAPGCEDSNMACPAVCYGRCVPATNPSECWSDADCAEGFYCQFLEAATNDGAGAPCIDEDGTGCMIARSGVCVRRECPEYGPIYCPSGNILPGGIGPDGCPLPPVCVDDCASLSREECELDPACMLVELPTDESCYCEPCQDETGANCDCTCPVSGWACVPRGPIDRCELLGEQECLANPSCEAEYAEACACPACEPTSSSDCPPCWCERQFVGCHLAEPQGCEGLDERSCLMRPECEAIYIEEMICTDCEPNSSDCQGGCFSQRVFAGCQDAEQPQRCLGDEDCPRGFFCAFFDTVNSGGAERPCLDENGDGMCDDGMVAEGICQPIEPRCGDNGECAPGEACIDGWCVPIDPCAGLDEQACLASAPQCEPVYLYVDCLCTECRDSNDCPPCDCGTGQVFAECVSARTECIQVITPAMNPDTGECVEFPTPCDVPEGWGPCDLTCDANGVCTP
ncbi:MAG: hypothetical protein JXR83_20705 [Deltaproteobacteria bacterium]|nr:hypothetical protein [Deltaproteobacteria bacterium]